MTRATASHPALFVLTADEPRVPECLTSMAKCTVSLHKPCSSARSWDAPEARTTVRESGTNTACKTVCSKGGVVPEGLDPIESWLLNGPVVGVRRARPAIPDDRSPICTEEVSPKIVHSVVSGERSLLTKVPLKPEEPAPACTKTE